MKKLFARCSVLAGLLALAAGNAFAAIDLTGMTINTADVESVVELVLPGLLIMWGIRKLIKTTNRS